MTTYENWMFILLICGPGFVLLATIELRDWIDCRAARKVNLVRRLTEKE